MERDGKEVVSSHQIPMKRLEVTGSSGQCIAPLPPNLVNLCPISPIRPILSEDDPITDDEEPQNTVPMTYHNSALVSTTILQDRSFIDNVACLRKEKVKVPARFTGKDM